jgi:hypothetical protein
MTVSGIKVSRNINTEFGNIALKQATKYILNYKTELNTTVQQTGIMGRSRLLVTTVPIHTPSGAGISLPLTGFDDQWHIQ